VRFEINHMTREPKIALFAFWRRVIKLYVVPICDLKNLSWVWLPADGIYARANNKKPKRDWTLYANAWHVLDRIRAMSPETKHRARAAY
jgi:hypothetical protein